MRGTYLPLLPMVLWTAAFAPCASAQQATPSAAAWRPVDDARLDAARGGFDLGNGLVASFGIARQVFVNGLLVASANASVPDVAHMTTAQATALVAATRTNVVQIGPGNSFDPTSLRQSSGGTAIQNTLDNQHVQTLTTLNATVNNLDLYRSLQLQNSLQSALIDSRAH